MVEKCDIKPDKPDKFRELNGAQSIYENKMRTLMPKTKSILNRVSSYNKRI